MQPPPFRLHLTGLVGSAPSFVAASTIKQGSGNHLFILNTKEEAAYFQNDLNNLLNKKDVLFFPDSYKLPGKFDEINKTNLQSRTEMVTRFLKQETKREIMVTYPESLFEKVIDPEAINRGGIHIEISKEMDMYEMVSFLEDHGFKRSDFVYEPGEFSIRGGIMDVFSFGNEIPYRIELNGDEIRSIRTFDPVSQLSEKKISKLSILPNAQTGYYDAEKVSFLDNLPSDTTIWVQDIQFMIDNMSQSFEKAMIVFQEGKEQGEDPLGGEPKDLFETARSLNMQLQSKNIIEISSKKYFQSSQEIQFNMRPQPSFNRNVRLLADDLVKNSEQQFVNIIFSDNTRQIERFYSIFEDMDKEIAFFPIPIAISNGFIDKDNKLVCYTDHQIFERFHRYQVKTGYSRNKALLMKTIRALNPGDYITHIDHGVGVYSGLEKIEVRGKIQEAIRIVYRDNDLLYVNINSLHKVSKYAGKEGTKPRINKLGSEAWQSLKRKTKKKVKDIAKDLIKLYAERKASEGFSFSPDTYLQAAVESSFIYEDTPDQVTATVSVKEDMEKPHPMDRLICGDGGFGKTEIAVRAAFKAVADSKQVAILVPTTILALQHFRTFQERLEDLPCVVDYINRFKTRKEITQTLKDLEEGKIDILIGTHALLGKQVSFKDLGLLIIDEEQKFGVAAKEKLRRLRSNVDTLTLTATPIPRTLQFSMMGARDLSIINTPPPNRQPIHTEVHVHDDVLLKDAIYYEVNRGGQVFLVHNLVKNINEIAELVRQLCPDLSLDIAHGQMKGRQLEDTMKRFINKEFDILVSTNIIESGLDIPNANTIIINNAHHFGLSDLHQLRGRVGRSNIKAYCYLITPPAFMLSSDARKRLQTIEDFSDLGSGLNIAMRDLDIRGAGNLLGGEQSGFIAEIGFDMYHKILDEAIQELKETDFKHLFKDDLTKNTQFAKDCQIDTDMELMIPDKYISNINERLSLYTQLDNIEEEEKLTEFKLQMEDRFGALPIQVIELCEAIRLRWLAKILGFERLVLKKGLMRSYFIANQDSPFYESAIFRQILEYVQHNPSQFKLKQTEKNLILTFADASTLEKAYTNLKDLSDHVQEATLKAQ